MTTLRRAPALLRSSLVLLATALAASPARGEVIDKILIHVNSRIITQSQLDARLATALREAPTAPDLAQIEQMKKGLVEELVNEALLEDRARELDVVATDAEVEEQIKHLKEQNNVTTDEDFQKALAASGLTPDKLRDQLKKSLTVQRVVGREVHSKVDLSDDALRLVYEREKDQKWKVPEKARLSEVFIAAGGTAAAQADAERRVREASLAIKGGTKFEDVVARFSEGPSASRGGDLGTFSPGELAPELDKAVFSLPLNGVSDPILTKNGWHIVKVTEKAPVSYKPFAEVKADIFKREQDTQFQKKLAEYLEKLKRDAVIRVAPEAEGYYTPPTPDPLAEGMTSGPAPAGDEGAGDAPPTEKASPSSGGAERKIEITPTVGWRLGGTASTFSSARIESLKVANALSFGLTAEYALSRSATLELLFSHQDTELKLGYRETPPAGYTERLTHLNVDTFQIGGLWQSGRPGDSLRGYLDLLLGVSLLTPSPQLSALTRLSASVGGGAKVRLTDALGARVGLRFMPIYVNATSSGYSTCDAWYGCYTYYDSNYLYQWDFHTGMTFRF